MVAGTVQIYMDHLSQKPRKFQPGSLHKRKDEQFGVEATKNGFPSKYPS